MQFRQAAIAVALVVQTPAAAQTVPAPAPAAPLTLDLVCDGSGDVNRSVPDHYRDKDGKDQTRYRTEKRRFDGTLQLRFRPNGGTALVPPAMATDGVSAAEWRQLKKVTVGADAIDGKIDLGFLYAPKMHVDRVTGMVTVDGSQSSFSGQCRAIDPRDRAF